MMLKNQSFIDVAAEEEGPYFPPTPFPQYSKGNPLNYARSHSQKQSPLKKGALLLFID
jgi:hypothetical protein